MEFFELPIEIKVIAAQLLADKIREPEAVTGTKANPEELADEVSRAFINLFCADKHGHIHSCND